MDEDPFVFWRQATDLSVVDAAILMAGGDPSETETVENEYGGPETIKKTTGHPTYAGAFTMLTLAILNGRLRARLAYVISNGDVDPLLQDRNCWVVSGQELGRLLAGDQRDRVAEYEELEIQRGPDWARSTVAVEDLRTWLQSRGITQGFFSPTVEAAPEDFLNPAHRHFAPELALAVAAWRALSETSKFPRGVKTALREWIAANPKAWQGEDPLTDKARGRVSTVANWNSQGGAPRTGN